jgi:hypothetical protein
MNFGVFQNTAAVEQCTRIMYLISHYSEYWKAYKERKKERKREKQQKKKERTNEWKEEKINIFAYFIQLSSGRDDIHNIHKRDMFMKISLEKFTFIFLYFCCVFFC